MAHTEGYRLTVDDDTNRVQVRISPKPYKKVKGHLRGEPDAMDELRDAITSDEVDVGQAELLSRKSKIFDESSKCSALRDTAMACTTYTSRSHASSTCPNPTPLILWSA
ncbi:Transposable element [Halapricum desulfuricans]|nr:Transposable element [Halapricum desulfuricans]